MDNNTLTALVLAALDDSAIKALNERINELAELGFKPQIVTELPEEGNDHTLYLVLASEPGEDPWYQEYLWLDNEWEKIGTTSIDFENYYTKDEADSKFVQQLIGTSQQGGTINNMGEDGILIGVAREDLGNASGINVSDGFIDIVGTSDLGETGVRVDSSAGTIEGHAIDDIYFNVPGSSLDLYADHAEMYAGEASLEMDGTEGTITLDAPNGVKVLSAPVENDDISTKGYVDTELSTALQNYYTKSQTYNKTEVNQLVEEVGRQLFDGTSEEWDTLTEEEKVAFVIAAVEDYVELNIADTYNVNEALGNVDPQETIVSDLYEDEAIDLTNQIIGGE